MFGPAPAGGIGVHDAEVRPPFRGDAACEVAQGYGAGGGDADPDPVGGEGDGAEAAQQPPVPELARAVCQRAWSVPGAGVGTVMAQVSSMARVIRRRVPSSSRALARTRL